MERQILGIAAASIAVPYFAPFLMLGFESLTWPAEIPERASFLNASLFGAYAVVFLGLLLALVGSLLAFLLHRLAIRSKWPPILGGGILGLCVPYAIEPVSHSRPIFLLTLEPGSRHFYLAGVLSGAIYGWIDWRIALLQRAQDSPTDHKEAVLP